MNHQDTPVGRQSWGSLTPMYPVTAGKPHRGVGNEGLGVHGPAMRNSGPGTPKLLYIQVPLSHKEQVMELGVHRLRTTKSPGPGKYELLLSSLTDDSP